MVIEEENDLAFVMAELSGKVHVFRLSQNELIQSLELLPSTYQGVPSGAAIKKHPHLPIVYASNRGAEIISVISYSEDGNCELTETISLKEVTPRDFNVSLDGKCLVVGGQDSHTLSFYKIKEDGLLDYQTTIEGVKSPSCIQFLR